MDWLAVILGGILAGIIAKSIVPGNEPSGYIADALIGIVGGIIGKVVLGAVGMEYGGPLWNLVVAVIGAVILLVVYHALTGRRGDSY